MSADRATRAADPTANFAQASDNPQALNGPATEGVGHSHPPEKPQTPPNSQAPEAKGLCVKALTLPNYTSATLAPLSLTAPKGKLTGLIGPNGAGKSTLLTALTGTLPSAPLSGRISFDGQALASLSPRARARLLALVEQSTATDIRLSLREAVALGRIPHQSLWQRQESPADRAAIDHALALTGLTHRAAQPYASLSGGERQRAQIARALAQEPQLLILDEPTSSLDIRAQLLLMQLLTHLSSTGVTILTALHDLNLAARFCAHLVVMARGGVITEGPPASVLTQGLIREVYGVDARISGATPPQIEFHAPIP